jgi:pimeloyl-ACP methyl ester carboxylesterase
MTTLPTRVTHYARRRATGAAILLAAMALVVVSLTPAQSLVAEHGPSKPPKPTIVLVHGSWADGSSWNRVIERLQDDGYKVAAIPNPLRSLSGDAASVRAYLESVTGPIVLVAHSYGGAVITNAATGVANVKRLVYVNAFAPDAGQVPLDLAGPDSALATDPTTVFDFVPPTLPPGPTADVYLKRSTVFASFATGLSSDAKAIVAATQRPALLGAFAEASGAPAWKTIPSWYLLGTEDQIIPESAQRAMAEHAGSKIVEYDEPHRGLMTDPKTVTRVIERAAREAVR